MIYPIYAINLGLTYQIYSRAALAAGIVLPVSTGFQFHFITPTQFVQFRPSFASLASELFFGVFSPTVFNYIQLVCV